MSYENAVAQQGVGQGVAVAKPRTWVRKLAKWTFRVSVSAVVLLFAVQSYTKYSGSNQWELVGEKKGVRVFSLKEPGMDLMQFKTVGRVRATLGSFVKWLQDPEACTDIGCNESVIVERVNDHLQYVAFQFNTGQFKPREFVLRVQTYQNPVTREVFVEYAATPEKTPPNDCCFRVTSMNNWWRLIPLPSGEIDYEYAVNMNEGGFIPSFMLNNFRPMYMFSQFGKLQAYLDRDQYKGAKFDFIKE